MNLEVIRDAFLEGKDPKAVVLLLESLINLIEPEIEIDNESHPENYIGITSPGLILEDELYWIVSRPQSIAFRPNRFVVASSIASSFIITSIRVGNVSQGLSNVPISAELFSSSRRRFPRIVFDTVQVAMDLSVEVRNISSSPTLFMGGFFGPSSR